MEKVRAMMIIEIAGRPPEHLIGRLKEHVRKIKSIKDVGYLSETFSDAKKINEEKDVYTAFAEVEVETNTFSRLIELIFDFMPSSVEVVSPKEVNLDMHGATGILNDLAGRLHKYDEVAKIAKLQNQQLTKKLQEMQKQGNSEKESSKS